MQITTFALDKSTTFSFTAALSVTILNVTTIHTYINYDYCFFL